MAEERGALLGHEVGYTIRFDDCSDPHATRIKVFGVRRVCVALAISFSCVLLYESPVLFVWGVKKILEVVLEKTNLDLSLDVNVSHYFKRLSRDQPQQY